MIRHFLITISLIFLASCGSDEALELDEQQGAQGPPCTEEIDNRLTMEVIIGELDWLDYLDLQKAREIRNSKSTGQIKIPAINASCTAFLVNENTIMTNNHCVPNHFYSKGVRLFLRDENELKEDFYCEKLLATNASLDFSLLECDGYPGDKYGYIPLSLNIPSRDQRMYLVQENCDYLNNPRCRVHKYMAKGIVHRVGHNSISHDADTLGGSSGSPIFHQETHELIGIHHAGMKESDSKPAMNFGVPMYRIANYLFDNHPEIQVYESVTVEDQDDTITDGCHSSK